MTVTRIPVVRIGRFLLVTIPGHADDAMIEQLQTDLLERVRDASARGVLLDVSGVEVVDSFLARSLSEIGRMARFLNAKVVVVGIQPAVAMTLVELGLKLPGVRTALNVDHGLQLLGSGGEREPANTSRSEIR